MLGIIHIHRLAFVGHSSILLLAFSLGFAASSSATVVFVNKNASGSVSDGASWATAFSTVQAGAHAALSGDEVWVAASLPAAAAYLENITVPAGIALYGGFSGIETVRGQRDAVANVTVLDGNRAGTVLTAFSGVVIDGFTIRNGLSTTHSGGMYVNGNVTIANNTISGNSAGTFGGGIFVRGGTATITNDTITGNTAIGGSGGGIYINGTANISNSVISRNLASGGYGGGIYVGSVGTAVITNDTIAGNTAYPLYGGGIWVEKGGAATITNDTITGNSAVSGGGIDVYGTATISNTIVAFNSSGIYNSASPLVLRNNNVFGNDTYDYSQGNSPTGTNGNISVDPQLTNTYHDVHLKPTSPCINAGDDSVVTSGETDIDGQGRVQGSHVDIGSDESDGMAHDVPSVVWHVSSASGNDAADGLAWERAKKTVNGALAASQGGDEVWVAKGVYTENITVPAGVALYGGFSGSETERGQRNSGVNATVVDGGQSGSVVTGFQNITIDGFTIQNGNATSSGGGIFLIGRGAIVNNNITGNTAYPSGGGIYATGSVVKVINNTITGNSSTYFGGGGIYLASGSKATITNNTITGNAASLGGGIYLDGATTITNTIVASNSSGIHTYSGTTLTLRNNDVFGNDAYNYSGVSDPTGTNGNISVDPRLANAYHDVHLQPTSPCINAGDGTVVTSGATDIDGQARIQGMHVDIGSDESDGMAHDVPSVTWYVSTSIGSDSADGLAWGRAKKTVSGALAVAQGSDEVWVAKGVYRENITLPAGVALYGGFSGSETERSQRNATANMTVLDGNQLATVVTGFQGITIDGFTIQNGNEQFTNTRYGGGICQTGSATITNDIVSGNTSGPYGGGIYMNGGVVTVARSTISGNSPSGGNGGGIFVNQGTANISNDVISTNQSAMGGGVYVKAGTANIANCTIVNNSGESGGGLYVAAGAAHVTNSILAFNSTGIFSSASALVTVDHSDVYGSTGSGFTGLPDPTGTNGNISADPRFVTRYKSGFRLLSGSPCIDAGDDTAVTTGETDRDGAPRISGSHVDLGAYEYGSGNRFAIEDVITTLQIAGGLSVSDVADLSMLNIEAGGGVDLIDAVRIARKAAGLEANL